MEGKRREGGKKVNQDLNLLWATCPAGGLSFCSPLVHGGEMTQPPVAASRVSDGERKV